MSRKLPENISRSALALLLIFAIALDMFYISAQGMINVAAVESTAEYHVGYRVVTEWADTRSVEVTVFNDGKNVLPNWAVAFEQEGEISGLWDAQIYKQESSKYIIKNSGYNRDIQPGGKITFGYTLKGGDKKIPEFLLATKRVAVSGAEVKLISYSGWGGYFSGEFEITNLTNNEIIAWEATILKNFDVNSIWSGKAKEKSDDYITISGEYSNSDLKPKSTTKVSFEGEMRDEHLNIETVLFTGIQFDDTIFSKIGETEKEEKDSNIKIVAASASFESPDILKFVWFATEKGGVFEILQSSDNKIFGSLHVVGSGGEYDYKIKEDFSEKWFKVRQKFPNGSHIDSPAFAVYGSNGYYRVESLDSDGDGLPDYLETLLGLDPNKSDTDGDGISDYDEIYLSLTDPLVWDSIVKGIADGEADLDDDGLSTASEIKIGTDSNNFDTDGDGLSDGAEFLGTRFRTNPLKFDTDGDGISDGDELKLGLDPIDPTDGKKIISQNLNSQNKIFEEINTPENPYKISARIKTAGLAENIEVRHSASESAVKNPATLGIVAEFVRNENFNFDEIEMYFNIDNSVVQANESGLDRFVVFKYFEDINSLLPIETSYDKNNNRISAKSDDLGTFCVIDMNALVESWSVSTEKEAIETLTGGVSYHSSASSSGENSVKKITDVEKAVNVVFMLDSRNSVSGINSNIADQIAKISAAMGDNCKNANVYIAKFGDSRNSFIFLNGGNPVNIDDASLISRNVSRAVAELTSYPIVDSVIVSDAFKDVADLAAKTGFPTFAFSIFDEDKVLFRESNGVSNYSECVQNNAKLSIIAPIVNNEKIGYVIDAMNGTGGIHIDKFDDFCDDVLSFIFGADYINPSEEQEFNIILSQNLKKITLNAPISYEYKEAFDDVKRVPQNISKYTDFVDTDSDGLRDFQEIDFNDGSIAADKTTGVGLPTFAEYLNRHGFARVEFNKILDDIDDVRVLPVISDPTMADSDGDGIEDGYDLKPNKSDAFTFGDSGYRHISKLENLYLTINGEALEF